MISRRRLTRASACSSGYCVPANQRCFTAGRRSKKNSPLGYVRASSEMAR
ncbi:unnamed protein product [Chondrus crispus]|uniref:Uncharacterized protein n=1 Tax=Chondrus crispus TaxID=2769 RepID=R7QCL8_CHOCR|nr:unnamed protein product [Chondrus crispus]CDF35488.1 unnamed protein product [Chondrus crispus]|eukprot:XP_005715307.1 unnamed protein product [Chondrus crispus]